MNGEKFFNLYSWYLYFFVFFSIFGNTRFTSKKSTYIFKSSSNISKTSASVSSGVPNTEKQMKARGRRPIAFIVSRCLEPLMKHEARVFEMASQTSVKISWNFFRRISHQKV